MNKPALSGAVKILADGAKDVVAAMQPGDTLVDRISKFENLIPDAMAEVNQISDFGAEYASLTSDDVMDLGGELVTDLGFSSPHAIAIVNASLKLLADTKSSGVIGDVIALLHAVKNPPAAA